MEDKIFLGFGVLAFICGILLILEQKYLIGVSGAIVGAWLGYMNYVKIKNKSDNQNK